MKKNKIFGISAVVLMVLLAVVPLVNAVVTEKIKETGAFNETYDLEVVDVGNAVYDKYQNGEYFFDISYKIVNKGEEEYAGSPLTKVKIKDGERVFDYWSEDYISLGSGESTEDLAHKFVIDSRDYIHITQMNFELESAVASGCDRDPSNNRFRGISLGWWNKDKPNKDEVLGMTPCSIKEFTKTIDGEEHSFPVPMMGSWWSVLTYLLDTVDKISIDALEVGVEGVINTLWNTIPENFANQRLGWVNDFTENLAYLSLYCTIVMLKIGQFFAQTYDEFLVIANFITDLVACFSGNVVAFPIGKIDDVAQAVTGICEEVISWGPEIVETVLKVRDKWFDLQDWLNEENWLNDISASITVNNVNDYQQPITVECLGTSRKFSDSDGDNKISETFNVKTEPWVANKCQITVKAYSKKDNELGKKDTAWMYCFPGGKVSGNVRLSNQVKAKSWKLADSPLINYILQFYENWNMPKVQVA